MPRNGLIGDDHRAPGELSDAEKMLREGRALGSFHRMLPEARLYDDQEPALAETVDAQLQMVYRQLFHLERKIDKVLENTQPRTRETEAGHIIEKRKSGLYVVI